MNLELFLKHWSYFGINLVTETIEAGLIRIYYHSYNDEETDLETTDGYELKMYYGLEIEATFKTNGEPIHISITSCG